MQVIQKAVKDLEGIDYYIKHLNIINPFLPVQLTPKEMEVLGAFMAFKGEIAEQDRFGLSFKKIVKQKLNQSDGGLSNHLTSLKNKGAILVGELDGKLSIRDFLFPEEGRQMYQFVIIQKDNNPKIML